MVIAVGKTVRQLFCIAFFVLFFYFPKSVFAFTEIFNTGFSNPGVWESSGNATFNETHLRLLNYQRAQSFAYVRSVSSIFPSSGAVNLKIDFSYLLTGPFGNFGDGLAVSPDTPPPFGTTLGPDHKKYILFLVWQDPGGFKLYTTTCPETNPGCSKSLSLIYGGGGIRDYGSHSLLLRLNESGQYFLSLDSENNVVYKSATNQGRPGGLWFGSPEFTLTSDYWNSIEIDNVQIGDIAPEPVKPIIVIPGLGASWDFPAILGGTAGTNWQIPSFVNLYQNLINSLKNAGYVEGTNLFVFGYDWRKGLTDLANDLDGYINGLVAGGKIGTAEKIDLIGHSYGGLVARTYGQNIGTSKIDKIITAGSPHQGAIDAYGIWEGATAWKNVWWQRAALELLVKLNQRPGESRVGVVRRLAPGIKDSLPTFDFLKKNDILLASESLIQKNATLTNLNANQAVIDNRLRANGGTGNQTDRFLKVVDRTWLDRTLGLWEDGKPTSSPFETTTDGDGAVLAASSTNGFVNQALILANHEQVIATQTALEKIFEELGLDKTKIVVPTEPDSRKSVFIASLRSPGSLHICAGTICDANLGIYLPSEKLFFLPGYEQQLLTTSVEAGGETGGYKLYLGQMDEGTAKWSDVNGNLTSPTQVDSYQVTTDNDGVVVVGNESTTDRSFDEDVNKLNNLLPGWDKKNLLAIARSNSQSLNKRIVAIRQLRELLSTLVIKANKNSRADQVEAMFDVWVDLDNLAEVVIGDRNTTKAAFLNANIIQVEAYKVLVDNLLKNSSSYYAGTFYNLFSERFAEAKGIKTTARDLSLDKTLSARYLLLTALGVR